MHGHRQMTRRTRVSLSTLSLAALVLAASCSRSEQGGVPGPAYDPCAGKSCGATCTTCDPEDPTCAGDAVVRYCNTAGECLLPFPVCAVPECKVDGDCAQIESCTVCPDGSASCSEARCIDGHCFTRFPPCPGECQTAKDCPPLGMPCQACADGSVACPSSDCVAGECVVTYPRCGGYDPCAGKVCGAPCTVCDPKGPSCYETAVLKFCDAGEACRPSNPTCPPPGNCTTTADCPGVGACPRCPGDQCAELECIDGSCVFTCPPVPPPQCKTDVDCPQLGMPCLACPDGWSACPSVTCESGSCVAHFPTCDGHDPCAGKACGDACDLCGGACASPVAMYCHEGGQCTVGVPACGNVCTLPPVVGPCAAAMPRWYFDPATGKCTPFTYGGCGGNENNFQTPAACVTACAANAATPCDAIKCATDAQCLYVGAEPTCAAPCGAGSTCPPGLSCGCAASCPYCKNCVNACVPQ